MKKINFSVIILTFAIILGLAGGLSSMKAEAAYNVKKSAAVVRGGSWVQNYKGYRYQYKTNKYYKNCWKKINGKIYFFDKKGYMVTGWVKYKSAYYYLNEAAGSSNGALLTKWRTLGGKRYYMSNTTGAMFTGWNTISGKRYYFDKSSKNLGAMVKNKWVGSYYLNADGSMARDCYVKKGNCWVDKNGKKIVNKEPDETPSEKPVVPPTNPGSSGTHRYDSYIFVGDSRTVGMENSVSGSAKYIAEIGQGYWWLKSTALTKLKAELKKNPYVKVVFNLGVNDCAGNTVDSYISAYRQLIESYPTTKFYIMSVNPINDKAAAKAGFIARNNMVTQFNSHMKAAFSGIYIDTYNYLKLNGFSAPDGIHYTNDTYLKIYNYILKNS